MTKRRRFHGATYNPARDHDRLSAQYDQVFAVMRDGKARTFSRIRLEAWRKFDVLHPLPSISARLRDMRKPEFGGHTVESECVRQGLWLYRLILRRRPRKVRR